MRISDWSSDVCSSDIVTSSGYPLQPGIQIPTGAQSISISTDGIVSVQMSGEPQPQQVGQILTADFINHAGLQPKGENLYTETAARSEEHTSELPSLMRISYAFFFLKQ